MEYTKNYHLPQWKEDDRIMMRDFNQMCADMEKGLTEAKTTADEAQHSADEAYRDSFKPYAAGTYTGNSGTQEINVGFRPRFVLVSGDDGAGSLTDHYQSLGYYFGVIGPDLAYDTAVLTDAGFLVKNISNRYPQLNRMPNKYNYIAFR